MEHLLNDNLLKYFTEYALKEGNTTALSIAGLKSLLQNQFAQYLKVSFLCLYSLCFLGNGQEKAISHWCCKAGYCAQMASLTP